eukprot:EG_transcript_17452
MLSPSYTYPTPGGSYYASQYPPVYDAPLRGYADNSYFGDRWEDSYGYDRRPGGYDRGYDRRYEEDDRRYGDDRRYDRRPEFSPAVDRAIYSRPKLPKLYVSKISSNCLGPWLLLKEIGLPFELVEVDLTKGDNHTNEFLAMNPMGQVPTYVETDGIVVWESNAIMRFICEKHTGPKHLYPRDVNLRGRIEMALDWRQTVLYPNIAKVCYPALGFTKDRSRVAEGKESLDKDLRILTDFFLRETPFIGGALPCIADYAIGFPLLFLYATDYRLPPRVREYLENLASKSPAWNEVTEELKRYISRL